MKPSGAVAVDPVTSRPLRPLAAVSAELWYLCALVMLMVNVCDDVPPRLSVIVAVTVALPLAFGLGVNVNWPLLSSFGWPLVVNIAGLLTFVTANVNVCGTATSSAGPTLMFFAQFG